MRLGPIMTAVAITVSVAGCGTSAHRPATPPLPAALVREARPIGRGPRFAPPATGPIVGRCEHPLGARAGVHLEVFAANRVVVVAAGIGTRPPREYSEGRIAAARCFGALVTLEPTGVILVRAGARLDLADLFRSWGQRLSARALTSFNGAVRVYVDGHRRFGAPGTVALTPHREVVLEVGPYVPPHSRYTFPPGT